MKEVLVKGHAHSFNTHWYKKVEGVWKFAGLNPDIRWTEYNFDQVFAAGRSELGEETGEQASGKSNIFLLFCWRFADVSIVQASLSHSSRQGVAVEDREEDDVDEQRDLDISVEPVIKSCVQTIKAGLLS